MILRIALLTLALVLVAPAAGAQASTPTPNVGGNSASAPTTAPALPRGFVRLSLPAATHDIARGDTIRAGDFALVDTTLVWRWATPPDTTREIAGWVARRPIVAGELLRAPAVAAPSLVSAGATVTVLYQEGPVRLTLKGIATNSASLGAPVSVRVDGTRRLDGVAVANNTVRLR